MKEWVKSIWRRYAQMLSAGSIFATAVAEMLHPRPVAFGGQGSDQEPQARLVAQASAPSCPPRRSSGSFAIFTAIRRASSRVRSCVFTPLTSIKSRENYCAGKHEG